MVSHSLVATSLLATTLILGSCSTAVSPKSYPPIEGSITYSGQPRSKLTKVPIGSTFQHEFRRGASDYYIETYQVDAKRNLQIIRRVHKREFLFPL